MSKLSIKMRITLWYLALMTLLLFTVFGLLLFVSQYVVTSDAREHLIAAVESNSTEVEYDDGALDIDDDFAYSVDGVTLVVYSSSGALLSGFLPQGFITEEALEDGVLKTVESGTKQYYIYDRRVSAGNEVGLWVRGVVAVDGGTSIVNIVLRVAGIALPLVVIIGALVGYQITKRSFKPIDAITQAAEEIGKGSDLSRRIQLAKGRDEIHQLAATFNLMFARLEASFEEEKRFTSDVSHELRTPTAVIMSQCEYALAHVDNEEEYRAAIEVIKRQVDKMSALIDQLLVFTRIEQGVEKIHKERTDFSELVISVCKEQEDLSIEGITLWQDIPRGIEAAVDRSLVTRLLSNLISNAYQYGKPGGNIWVSLRQENGIIRLFVADDGIGIPQESVPMIWSRFYQVDPSRTPTESGSMGLGLAMVDQIARLHNGHMELTSEFGKGTTVVFVFAPGIQ